MVTKERLENDLRQAIKARDDVRKRTLRMALTAIKFKEVDQKDPLDEATLLSLLQKEVRTRLETIEEAERGGREDIASSSQAEIGVLRSYLPEPLALEEVETLARSVISEVGVISPGDMGKVMKELMPKLLGRADGKTASQLVKRLIEEIQATE